MTQVQREKMFSAIGKDTAGRLSPRSARFGSIVRRAEWAADRSRVKLDGVEFWLEMSVDAQVLHATADIPLSAVSFTSGLRQIIERTFPEKAINLKAAA